MITTIFYPAMIQLLLLQSRGRRRRMWGRFCQPRRLILSAIACVMAVVWLGNAAMTIWLRESASPHTLRAMLSLGLMLYAGWHFAKAAFFRPESPFDWTPAKREILAAMPLRPRDLVAYQVASVTVTTILKAGVFSLLLLPDLRSVPMGLAGLLLAMMMLEMLRMAIDIATWGMGRAAFLAYRVAVVAGLVAAGFAVGSVIVRDDAFSGQINVGDGLLQRLLDLLVHLNDSALGYAALPFQPFIDLILADGMTPAKAGLTLAASGIVLVLAGAVIGLYAIISRRVSQREKRDYHPSGTARDRIAGSNHRETGATLGAAFPLRLWRIPRWGGAGALAWRQLIGARRHSGSLLTAMIAPAVFTCVPSFVIEDAHVAYLATAGTLAFYTFLLLPTALRFDFRRDLDCLATLKGLPITPAAAVIGQILAPVLIATLFQTAVLAFAVAARSLPPHLIALAMLVMIPMNVLVFGVDNLIYLLYPYRVQQEGLEIFLRTMLTFTGKGLLFAVALAAMSVWGFAAAALTRGVSHWTGATINAYTVFAGGMIAGPSLLAALVLYELCRTYRNMNPIEDIPR
jgi:hypothetical protein